MFVCVLQELSNHLSGPFSGTPAAAPHTTLFLRKVTQLVTQRGDFAVLHRPDPYILPIASSDGSPASPKAIICGYMVSYRGTILACSLVYGFDQKYSTPLCMVLCKGRSS